MKKGLIVGGKAIKSANSFSVPFSSISDPAASDISAVSGRLTDCLSSDKRGFSILPSDSSCIYLHTTNTHTDH